MVGSADVRHGQTNLNSLSLPLNFSPMYLGLSIFFSVVSLLGFLGHLLFRVMDWPGTPILRIAGIAGIGLAILFFILYRNQTTIKTIARQKDSKKPIEGNDSVEVESGEDFWNIEDDEK